MNVQVSFPQIHCSKFTSLFHVLVVTLQANEPGFIGFLLQARDETGPVGTFTVMGSNAQLLNCGTEVRCLFKNLYSAIICSPHNVVQTFMILGNFLQERSFALHYLSLLKCLDAYI